MAGISAIRNSFHQTVRQRLGLRPHMPTQG